jgi:hypothetical protein
MRLVAFAALTPAIRLFYSWDDRSIASLATRTGPESQPR